MATELTPREIRRRIAKGWCIYVSLIFLNVITPVAAFAVIRHPDLSPWVGLVFWSIVYLNSIRIVYVNNCQFEMIDHTRIEIFLLICSYFMTMFLPIGLLPSYPEFFRVFCAFMIALNGYVDLPGHPSFVKNGDAFDLRIPTFWRAWHE